MSDTEESGPAVAGPRGNRRWPVAAFLLLLLAGGGWLVWRSGPDAGRTDGRGGPASEAAAALPTPAGSPEATATNVRVIRPEPAAAARGLELPAESAPFEEAVLFARVDGYVRDRLVDIGDRVKAGQSLAFIDAPELERQLDRAQAQIRQTEANLQLARVTLQRADQLVRQGHVSRQTLDERQAEVGVREADLSAARAEAGRLQQLLQFRTVAAPFDGVVVARNIHRGTLVEADAPEPGRYLFRVARLDTLRVFAQVPQSDVAHIGVGTPAEVRFAEFPDAALRGTVVRTAGTLDPASRGLRVEVHLPNPQGLPAGMFGRVTFTPPAPAGLLTLPVNAVVGRAEGSFVATVTPSSTVRFLPVRLGRNLGARIEVESGLAADARVIVNPNALLRDDDPVQIQG